MTSFLDFYSPEDRKWLSQMFPNMKSSDPEVRASVNSIDRKKQEIARWIREQERKQQLEEDEEE